MKKLLTKIENNLYHYIDDKKISGKNPSMSGDCSYLYGDCSYLYGNCSALYGNCSRLSGNCTNLSGDLDACEISDAERSVGICIGDLIKEKP